MLRRSKRDTSGRAVMNDHFKRSSTLGGQFMRALVWHGKGDVRCDTVPDPIIEDPRDIIVKITSTAICGSDLHLYDHYMPAMEKGDILGHEPMGEVVEVGSAIAKFQKGDRLVIPFTICRSEER